jgi:hypothetical protein
MTWEEFRAFLVLDASWPAKGLAPGDLAQFAPDGLGLAAPMIVRPYGRMADPDFYGWHERVFDPFRGAPRNDAQGGTLYFDAYADEVQLHATLAIMGVAQDALVAEFVAFEGEADDPPTQRFLRQVRFMPRAALAVFGADEPPVKPAPEAKLKDAIAAFVAAERTHWYETSSLYGTLGGDGDWAKEHLGFGFMVENAWHRIYRLWSRPYLVTK